MKVIEYVATAFFGEYNGKDTADELFDAVSERIQKAEKAAYEAITEIETFIRSEFCRISEFELGQCKNLHTRHSDIEWLILGIAHIKSILDSKTHYDMLEDIFTCIEYGHDITPYLRSTIGRYNAYIISLENHNYLDIMHMMQKEFREYDAEMEADSLNK